MPTQKKINYLQQVVEEMTKLIASADESGLEVSRLKEFIDFRTSLIQESDRGSVLMAAAFIEDKLGYLLESYFIKNQNWQVSKKCHTKRLSMLFYENNYKKYNKSLERAKRPPVNFL